MCQLFEPPYQQILLQSLSPKSWNINRHCPVDQLQNILNHCRHGNHASNGRHNCDMKWCWWPLTIANHGQEPMNHSSPRYSPANWPLPWNQTSVATHQHEIKHPLLQTISTSHLLITALPHLPWLATICHYQPRVTLNQLLSTQQPFPISKNGYEHQPPRWKGKWVTIFPLL